VANASDNVIEIFLTTTEGKISMLNAETGEKHWESELGGRIVSRPFIDNNIYLITRPLESESKNLSNVTEIRNISENIKNLNYSTARAINAKTGLTEWQTKIPDESNTVEASVNSEFEQTFLYIFNKSLILVDNFGNLTSLNKDDGTLLWKRQMNLRFSAKPFFIKDKVMLATLEKQILVVSLEDGATIYSIPVSEAASALNYIEEKKQIIWGGRRGNVSSFINDFKNPSTNFIWKFRNGAEISDLTLTNRGILLSSFDNFMYLISEDQGKLIWKKRLGGRISDAPLVKDGYITVTNTADSSALILDLNSGKTVNKISLPEDLYFTGKPLFAQNKLVLTTQKGIFSFDSGSF
jgi:outer membrane protein assembly factor BamB